MRAIKLAFVSSRLDYWWTLKFFYLGHLKNLYTIQYNSLLYGVSYELLRKLGLQYRSFIIIIIIIYSFK